MPELRKDPIVGRWVILAVERASRPNQFARQAACQREVACPFCEGNEAETPEEVFAFRTQGTQPNRAGWRVRVVPNRYPALVTGDPGHQSNDPLCTVRPGDGVHEVIVESPRHVVRTSQLREDELCEVLAAYRDRLRHWKDCSSWTYGLLFKNIGEQAGATLEHLHSQLIVLPLVPIEVRAELAGSSDYFHQQGACVYCQMVQHEITANQRLVLVMTDFTAFCPFASRFAFETWIVPRHHASHFETIGVDEIRQLASVMHRVLGQLESLPQHPAYNLVLHTAPFDTLSLPFYHWHMEIIPRLSRPAGFEWGSGSAINCVDPQEAASRLRAGGG